MTVELTRPPSLRSYLEAGCDLDVIPDLEQYARIIVIGQALPWQMRAKLALSYDECAEEWLAGREASPFGPDVEIEPTPGTLRHYLWLAEGLMEPDVAKLFEEALPDEIRAVCMERIREIDEEVTAALEDAVSATDVDDELPDLDD